MFLFSTDKGRREMLQNCYSGCTVLLKKLLPNRGLPLQGYFNFYPLNMAICCINDLVLSCNPYILENYAVFFLLIRKTYLPLQRFRSGQRLTECGIDYIFVSILRRLFLTENLQNFKLNGIMDSKCLRCTYKCIRYF